MPPSALILCKPPALAFMALLWSSLCPLGPFPVWIPASRHLLVRVPGYNNGSRIIWMVQPGLVTPHPLVPAPGREGPPRGVPLPPRFPLGRLPVSHLPPLSISRWFW